MAKHKVYKTNPIRKYIILSLFILLFIGMGYSVLSTSLGVSGSVNVSEYDQTLYGVLEREARKGTYARKYTGAHQDSINNSLSTKDIYYWVGSDGNNVVFGEHCWKAVRTTDTGGIKLLYNGEPDDGKCLETRGTHPGYDSMSNIDLSESYYYSNDFSYDSNSKIFTLSNDAQLYTWNDSNYSDLIGKYTCKLSDKSTGCSTLYLVHSYVDSVTAKAMKIINSSSYYYYGKLPFNLNSGSPASIGYKYGDNYVSKTTTMTYKQTYKIYKNFISSNSISTIYYYADDIDWNNNVSNKYSLVNQYRVDSSSEYSSLVGKYTFGSYSATNSSSVFYIVAVDGSTMYYITLNNGELLSDYNPIYIGDNITDNLNGTYTVNSPTQYDITDWYSNYSSFANKYMSFSNSTSSNTIYLFNTSKTYYYYVSCSDKIVIAEGHSGNNLTDTLLVGKYLLAISPGDYSNYKYTCFSSNTTCSEEELKYIHAFESDGIDLVYNRYFGSSVTWNGSEYVLNNTIDITNYNKKNNLMTHHYFCLDYGKKKCSNVAFFWYINNFNSYNTTMNYLLLNDSNITTIQGVKDAMYKKNNNDSIIKFGIDHWYKHYLSNYSDYLEDTVFCNDRREKYSDTLVENGNIYRQYYFLTGGSGGYYKSLDCEEYDMFSVSNNKAKLDYPVGILSEPEYMLKGSKMKEGDFWLMSPIYFMESNSNSALVHHVSGYNYILNSHISASSTSGVSPVVSLKPGCFFASGDGTMENPYVVYTG